MKIILTQNQLKRVLIQEGHKEFTDILDLANVLSEWVIDVYKSNYIEALKSARQKKQINIDFKNGQIYLKNILKPTNTTQISNFITDSDLIIGFKKLPPNNGGTYRKEQNDLFIDLNNYSLNKKIYEHLKSSNFNLNETKINYILSIYKKDIKKGFVHELQHAYDNFKSKGKFDTGKKALKFQSLWNPKKGDYDDYPGNTYNLYMKLPHEMWGRFNEFLYDKDLSHISFSKLLDDFKKNYPGYDLIYPKDRKRLIKDLFKIHSEYQK